jgi:high affinity Mn2+ porin
VIIARLGYVLLGVAAIFSDWVRAGNVPLDSISQNWNFHFQQTIVVQYHPDFNAKYTGQNSLEPSEPSQTSVTSTFSVGRKLWNGGELYFNAELAGGNGLSGATGVAGFLNGETFRIGDPTPQVTVARFFLRQYFPLSDRTTTRSDEANQLAGAEPSDRISLCIGKISMTDYFDNNNYSHDPRTQFLNWALMANGAWDYPANTRGYTWGFVAELAQAPWAVRLSSAMVPTEANKSDMDEHVDKAHSETIEIERSYRIGTQRGILRLLGYHTQARMGSYRQAIQLTPGQIDVVATRDYGRSKYGFGLNVEHAFSENVGMMLRAGWNDGTHETWMFTEIDQSISSALVLDGSLWRRSGDVFGMALILNGISQDHLDYLKAGGYGFFIGDGKLNYSLESIAEAFYSISIPETHLSISADYQFVLNPAYNADRGPVHVLGMRAHVAF